MEIHDCSFLDSIVVSIPACHAGDQGSIPCRGALFPYFTQMRKKRRKSLASVGVEPTTFALLARRSNRLS